MQIYMLLIVYLFSAIYGRYRLEMTPSADTDESEVLSLRRNLKEEYLTYEAKVCM